MDAKGDDMKASHRALVLALSLLVCSCATNKGELVASQRSDGEWQFNGGYDATGFSPLTQINTGNASALREVARFRLPETMSFQSEVVVADDTIYVTTLKSTYAIDARAGTQR